MVQHARSVAVQTRGRKWCTAVPRRRDAGNDGTARGKEKRARNARPFGGSVRPAAGAGRRGGA
ncbi:hypothetical protein A8E25_07000 [Burkholderia cenocepacia]|nr:hypothetical protein WQ49_01890 [Burkholderia cenocepacia]ONR67594.1 hypothetical protein A8E17_00990 [Burkholderia cenocepacia]ONR75434.1 hypothetical protein A8E23_07800 [Burkholderia cenocepacia]ONR84419.1 hypothetical protein A8E22_09255 [Burkholderia cenocepacia]ONR98516.1 hypothetical protein A8E19_07655 [Burkholderia cenocepacia]